MEQDDAKIAENWWSGTAGPESGARTDGAKKEDPADWEALRQKFVAAHDSQAAPQPRRRPVSRRLLGMVSILGLLILSASLLLVIEDSTVPNQIRNAIAAVFEPPATAAAPVELTTSAAEKNDKRIPRRKNTRSFTPRSAALPVAPAVPREPPFTIEVVDRNRRTVLRAYDDPMQVAIEESPAVLASAPAVPSLVIEETVGPGGAVSTTTNVGASVVLSGIISADGRMRDLRVIRGPAEFVPAAMEAVRRWRFTAARHGEIAVGQPARVTVNMAIKTDNAARSK